MHDYVVQNKSYGAEHRLCYSQHISAKADMASQIHDSVHTILSIPFINELKIVFISKKKELFSTKDSLVSITKLVLQRPPIN